MRKLTLVTIFYLISTAASGNSLKIFVIPAAHKIQWSSNKALISSFLKSQASAYVENDSQDASRRAIGHVVAKIECSTIVRWTGISINPSRMIPQILNKGVEGMFLPAPNAYMQSEEEIKKFIVNNTKGSVVVKFPVDQQACREMLRMDDAHRSQKNLLFGPLMNTSLRYRSNMQMGGSGSTYAVALTKFDDSNDVDVKRWLEVVQLPGNGKKISFYSVQSMSDFAHSERQLTPSNAFSEEVIYKKRKVRLDGIEL